MTGCVNISTDGCYLYGDVTIDATSENIRLTNNWISTTTSSISARSVDMQNVRHTSKAYFRGHGTFFPVRGIRNLCDGDLEVWLNSQPLGFVGAPAANCVVEETSIVRWGSKSAKVIAAVGETGANLKFTLDANKFDRTETFFPRYITVRFWAYKPAADGFNPKITIGYTGLADPGGVFSLATEKWTPCQQSFRISSGYADPYVLIGRLTGEISEGEYIYVDGVTITEGDEAPPTWDDSMGTESDLRIGGSFLRAGEVDTMTGNETFAWGDGNVFIKDPGGAARNLNPSGYFPEGTEITVINTADAAEDITFDSGTLACPVHQNQRAVFVYDGSAWQIQNVTNTQGDKQSFSFMQSDVASSQAAVALDVLGLAGNGEYTMPYPGSIVGISVASNAARTAGTLTVDATIDGDVTGLQAVLNADNAQYHSATQARNADAFTVNKRVGVKITTDADWEPDGTPDIVVVVIVEM